MAACGRAALGPAPNRFETLRGSAWDSADQPSPYLESLRAGLRELGWVEGRNLKIGTFWATGLDDMAAATQQALASDPEVVVTQEFMAIAMLLSKAPKPVVFGFSGDPVDAKLAESWARPGGNFTGMSYLAIELVGKRVELLKEWLPDTKRVAVLARPQHPGVHLERAATEEVVKKLGMELSYFPYITRSFLPGRRRRQATKATSTRSSATSSPTAATHWSCFRTPACSR